MEQGETNGLRAGIDVGGTKIQAVVVDDQQRVLGQAKRRTPTEGDARDVLRTLAETLGEAAREAGVTTRSLAGVGIGTPGSVDATRGTVTHAGNLPGFTDEVPLASMLEREIGIEVKLGNDVGVAVDAEARLGVGRDAPSFVGIWWGTGVGGGVVLDGQRWLGRGAAGEIGHTIVRRGGARCPCGRRGCLEAYAGRRAMEQRAREHAAKGRETVLFELMKRKGADRLKSSIWAKALEEGDALAEHLVERALVALAAAAASTINLFDLDAVVIGGGLGTRLGAPYAERVAERMQAHLFRPRFAPPVYVSTLGDLGGALGASLLVAAPVAIHAFDD